MFQIVAKAVIVVHLPQQEPGALAAIRISRLACDDPPAEKPAGERTEPAIRVVDFLRFRMAGCKEGVIQRDRARGIDLGGVDYVTKPFNPVELAPLVRELLARVGRGERDDVRREKLSELRSLLARE